MPTITWQVGDMFSFPDGVGVVLEEVLEEKEQTGLIVLKKERKGYKICKGPVPSKAVPVYELATPFETSLLFLEMKIPAEMLLILYGASVATGIKPEVEI